MCHSTLLLAALAFASGCYSYSLRTVSPPPLPAAAPGEGQICVLRPHVQAFAVTAVVHDNGVLVGATRGPSWFCWRALPGHHVILSDADAVDEATLEVAPGGRYYLHQRVRNLFGFVRTKLAWVDEVEAERMMRRARYRVLSSVPGDEQLPTGEPVPAAVVTERGERSERKRGNAEPVATPYFVAPPSGG